MEDWREETDDTEEADEEEEEDVEPVSNGVMALRCT